MGRRTVHIESSAGKRKRRSAVIRQLAELCVGDPAIIVSYVEKTPFSVWIAVQRARLGKQLAFRIGTNGSYEIWLEGQPVAKRETMATDLDRVQAIDWKTPKLAPKDQDLVIRMANRYRFAPKHGRGGSLILMASRESGVDYHRAWRWSKLLASTKALSNTDEDFRRFLASFLRFIAQSEESLLAEQIHDKAKSGDAVTVRLTRRMYGIVSGVLKRTSYAHVFKLLDVGSPGKAPLYQVTCAAI